MREAATVVFRWWPEAFLLYGGANLVLFQGSVRDSADLDLHLRGDLPPAEQVTDVLRQGLEPFAKLLEQYPRSERVSVRSGFSQNWRVLTRRRSLIYDRPKSHGIRDSIRNRRAADGGAGNTRHGECQICIERRTPAPKGGSVLAPKGCKSQRRIRHPISPRSRRHTQRSSTRSSCGSPFRNIDQDASPSALQV
jgi:hypothetical protein